MKQLHEYDTPLTDEAEKECILDIQLLDFARDLERKLALCRDALKGVIENTPCSDPDCCDIAIKCEKARKCAIKALAATEPKQ